MGTLTDCVGPDEALQNVALNLCNIWFTPTANAAL